ncbi:MAG: hypothetical protein V1911_00425 [Candidatus Micrarchaeota archaeon]
MHTRKVMLIDENGKKFVVRNDSDFNTQYGLIEKKQLNKRSGAGADSVKTHLGHKYIMLEPTVTDMVEHMKMGSRPIYPYDSGIICALLNIRPGSKVLEAGTGSGGLATFMAELGAKVETYEREEEFYKKAVHNLGHYKNVKTHNSDIKKCRETGFDAVFLDLQNPDDYIAFANKKLRHGGMIGIYSPIMDDIKPVWRALEKNKFGEIRAVQLDLKELIVKKYTRVKDLLGFPGFFIWARKMM